MKLNLIEGNNALDIVNTQISMIGQGLSQGRKQLIIVPDRYALSMENLVLQKLNLTASFDIDVVSLARLSNKMLSTFQAPQILSSLGATMVIEMLLLQHEKELNCFGNTAKTIAFASVIFDSISQLKSCKISPEDLKNSLSKIQNKSLRLKFGDIALIYQYYEEFLSTVYVDSNNRLKLLCQTIADSQDFENTDVHFCNFDNITEQGLDVLKILLRQSNSVSVGTIVPDDSNNNADVYDTELYQNVTNVAKSLKVKPIVFYAQSTLPNIKKHIVQNIMAINPQKMELPTNQAIRVYSASNLRQEVEWLAIDIANKVRNGARFKDFAINCTNLEVYVPLIKRIFKQSNIPFWADAPFNLQGTEGYKLIQSALDCVQDYFQVKDVFRYIKNSLVGLDKKDCEIFENVVNKYCLSGGAFLNNNAPKNEDEDFNQYLIIKQKMLPLFTLYKNIKGSKTIAEYVSSLNVFIEEMNLEGNLELMTSYFLQKGDLERSSIARQNFAKIEYILTQMRDVMGQMECDFSEFNKIWRTGASTVTISPLPMSIDCVFVGQNLQSVFNQVDYFYIIGAIEGEFPAWVSDVGLIADADINTLSDFSIAISPTIRQVNIRSRFKTLQSFVFGSKMLSISYPINKGAEECKLASLVDGLLKIFTYNNQSVPCVSLTYMLNDDNAFGGQQERLAYLWANKQLILNGLVENIENREINPKFLATAKKVLSENGLSNTLNSLQQIKNNKVAINNLFEPDKLFFTEGKAGVTQIERFFECPYMHFLTYGLKLKQKKTARIEAVDVGNILHAVLERFGRVLREYGVLNEDKIDNIVNKIFNEVMQLKEFEYINFAGHNETMLSSLRQEAQNVCKAVNYQMQHSQYKIKFIEAKFGASNFVAVPEIAIINTNKKVKINGKIDRADICGNRLRIIDYKTSKHSADFKLLNFYLGKKIQLFYYMQVILSQLNMQAGGAYYLPVHKEYSTEEPSSEFSRYCMQGVVLDDTANLIKQDDQISFENNASDIIKVAISNSKANMQSGEFVIAKNVGIVANEEQFGNLLQYAKNVLEGAINDIYGGLIQPLMTADACKFCPYKQICRVDVLIEKKQRSENFDINLDTFNFEDK